MAGIEPVRKNCSRCGEYYHLKLGSLGMRNICYECEKRARERAEETRTKSLRSPFSPRQRQVIARIAQGDSNKAISNLLLISEGTLKVYVSKIFSKIRARGVEIRTRTDAALWAIRNPGEWK